MKCNVLVNFIDGEGFCNVICLGSKNDIKIGNFCVFFLEVKVVGKFIKCIWEIGIFNNMFVFCIIICKFFK